MVRDEADVIGATIEHLINEGVDGIVVADNLSTDGTRSVLDRVAKDSPVPIVIAIDDEPGYYQSAKMTTLARWAHDEGASWIIPFDADELWYSTDEHRLADTLRNLRPDVGVVQATLWNHFATALDLDDPLPFRSMVYRHEDAGALPKVAFRWHPDAVILQGNHGVIHPGRVVTAGVELRHFPYRSFEQFCRKARNGAQAYAATDLGVDVGAHWRQYGELLERHGEDALREVWERWYWFLSPTDGHLVHDPAPFCRWTA
jgi:glycosyltransferase involved in cell wall biosynthesis